MKTLRVVGLSHRTAPVERREKLAVPEERVGVFLQTVRERAGVDEAVLLSTCNRVELYAVTPPEGDLECLLRKEMISLYGNLSLDSSLYALQDEEAIRHLFKVASGLDSLVIGETEILGQVKRSYEVAHRAGVTGKLTNVLFQRALHVGKKVRSETRVSEGPSSVPSAAVSLAQRLLKLSSCRVLVVGAGAMAEWAVQALKNEKVKEMVIANRTVDKAVSLAKRFGVGWASLSALPQELILADIVICSTGSPDVLFRVEDVAKTLDSRRGRSLFFIDISVPRDVDPGVNALKNVSLFNIDDLEAVIRESHGRRAKEMAGADGLVNGKTKDFSTWYRSWKQGNHSSLQHGSQRANLPPTTSLCLD